MALLSTDSGDMGALIWGDFQCCKHLRLDCWCWWESIEIRPRQHSCYGFKLQRHKQTLDPTEQIRASFTLQEPDVVGLRWLHEVTFLHTFPPVFMPALLYLASHLTELPDPVQSPHILSLLFWPPGCVCFVVSRKECFLVVSLRVPLR